MRVLDVGQRLLGAGRVACHRPGPGRPCRRRGRRAPRLATLTSSPALQPAVAGALGGGDHHGRLVRGAADDGDHGRPVPATRLRTSCTRRAQVVGADAVGSVRRCTDPPHVLVLGQDRRPRRPSRFFDFSAAISRSASFSWATIRATRSATWSGCTFRVSASPITSDALLGQLRRTPPSRRTPRPGGSRTRPRTRRSPPAARPGTTGRRGCPRTARATSRHPMSTTRTTSPYTSPNSAVAPDACASASGIRLGDDPEVGRGSPRWRAARSAPAGRRRPRGSSEKSSRM